MLALSRLAVAFAACWSLAESHMIMTYPGWRGDNLVTNATFPYGMQWMYPCGGIPSVNRTKWPVNGGAIAVQPGWNSGHPSAFFYVNLGFGTNPPNMSNPMVPVFQVVGPGKDPYPGASFCLPQVPLPVNASVKVGDNATIQVIETAIHGAALYNCVDITFADPSEVAEVNSTNCYNSTILSFQAVYATKPQSSASSRLHLTATYAFLLPLLAAAWAFGGGV